MKRASKTLAASTWVAAWASLQLFATAMPAEASWWKLAQRLGKPSSTATRSVAPAPKPPAPKPTPPPPKVAAPQTPKPTVQPRFNVKVEPSPRQKAFDNARYPPNMGFQGTTLPKANTTLRKGTVIDRANSPWGTYVAPAGTPTPARALPPTNKPRPFSAYVVEKDIPGVRSGKAAANYGQPGGGTQQVLPSPVEHLRANGALRQMEPKDRGFASLNFKAQATDRKPQ